jgi:AraC-like DNA-binding protein
MMQAQFVAPGTGSAFLVARYVLLTGLGSEAVFRDRFIPDGHVGLVFHFSGEFKVLHNGDIRDLPRLFYTRPLKSSLLIEVYPPAESMVVICKASVFSRVFGIDLGDPLAALFGLFDDTDLIRSFSRVFLANEPMQRIALFEETLWSRGGEEARVPDLVDKIYQTIMSGKGTGSVGELSAQFRIHPRTLRRKFHHRIGIPPKELFKVVRVHHLWSQMLHNPGLDTFDVVCEGGFYDQPHFIHDFRKIVGETPKAFFRRNQVTTLAFSAKEN